MRYIDRNGKEITPMSWGLLIRDREYSVLLRTENDELVVATSWIGIAHISEEHPRLYLVTRKRIEGNGKPKLTEVSWQYTERGALAKHKAWIPNPVFTIGKK